MRLIPLTDKSLKRIGKYAEAAGISTSDAASQAIEKWMDSTGDDVMSVLQERRRQRKEGKNSIPIRTAASPTPITALSQIILTA